MKLDERMKHYYEESTKQSLVHRMPVIIRIDGQAFHTFTKNFKKPFDRYVTFTMQETTKKLCENIQGCVLGYTQSDEISLLLIDYATLDASAWFDYNVQKLASVSASMATLYFNSIFRHKLIDDYELNDYDTERNKKVDMATFDSRAFNVPREEVTNYFYWRQKDAIRNSIAALGQSVFSQKELNGKSSASIKKMLMNKDIDWSSIDFNLQRGTAVKRDKEGKWVVDGKIPLFEKSGRDYIDTLLYPDYTM